MAVAGWLIGQVTRFAPFPRLSVVKSSPNINLGGPLSRTNHHSSFFRALIQGKTSVFIRSPMPRPKVRPENRQRSCRACLACKASKIRCDARDPCGSCLRRDQGNTCVYSGVDRRRKGQGKSRDVVSVDKVASLLAGLPSSHVSPNAPAIPMETPSSVERATPVLSPHAKAVDHSGREQESESYTSDKGGKGVASFCMLPPSTG